MERSLTHGELLELLHGARDRYRTLRGTLRLWRHHERAHAAHLRATANAERGRTSVAFFVGEASDPEIEQQRELRFWLELPGRLRAEEEAGRPSLLVLDGPRWWTYDARSGAITNEGALRHQHGLPFSALLLDPAPLLPGSRFALRGETAVAGRPALLVDVRPCSPSRLLDELGIPSPELALERELAVDSERGVVLRLTHLLDGEPYECEEFTEIAYDEPLPPTTFVFEPPSGEELRSVSDRRRRRRLPLHEVVRAAGFAVLAAERVPARWELLASHIAADERQGLPEAVHLHYVTPDASAQVNVGESAAGSALNDLLPPEVETRTTTRARGTYRVSELDVGDERKTVFVRFERDGTAVRLNSSDLDADALVEFADRFAPASAEPPALE